MILGPGIIFGILVVAIAISMLWLRWPLPLALIAASLLGALIAGYGVPYRHLVEGGFGYINLALGLFAGAFFGQVMRISGAAEAVAVRTERLLGGSAWAVLGFSAAIIFLVGMFIGIAGIAVLAAGVFVAPMLQRTGLPLHKSAAFIAVVATCGMIAPPLNVPAMTISDGVNMPYAGFTLPLLILSLPPTILAIVLAGVGRGAPPPWREAPSTSGAAATTGFLSLGLVLGFWTILRLFPGTVPDPAAPIVMVAGGLLALPLLGRGRFGQMMVATFSGIPLVLAAVLITVGVAVQIMTLTGIRGWLVMTAMSFPQPWTYLELLLIPILGGVFTSIGASNVLGVPFAFAFIGQDMILNSSALSAISALSEFMPPTAIAAALATYVVGAPSILRVLEACLLPALTIAVLAVLMLIFSDSLAAYLGTSGVAPRSH